MTGRIQPAPPAVPFCGCQFCRDHRGLGIRRIELRPRKAPRVAPRLKVRSLAILQAAYAHDVRLLGLDIVERELGL